MSQFFVKLNLEDVKGLIDNGYLRMNLQDFILHLTCTYSCDMRDIKYCLGGTVTRQWLEHMVMLIRRPKKQEKFGKLCNQLEGFDEGRHQIFVPDINKSHYSVIDIIIDKKSNYIMKVLYYDCPLQPKMKSLTSKNVPARIKKFIHNFIRVFNKFVLKIKNHSCDESKVLKEVVQVSCPVQQNGIDCRLFAVASCLHIFEGTQLGPHIFTQLLES